MEDALLRKVRRAIARHALFRAVDSVLVAVSGGPDSVALLAALVELNPGRWRIAAAHVNHRLRGRESDRDERLVAALARRLGVEFVALAATVRPGGNLEERARATRYRALLAAARRHGFRRVATGHTLDDQAETVLERMIRGSGIAGLAGIEPFRADGVVRPLLEASRADVERFVASRRLRVREDRTNRSPRFTRNRIRRRVLPILEREFHPGVKGVLGRLAALARDDEAVLAAAAARRLRSLSDGATLDARSLRRLPAALQRRVVRGWLAAARGHLRGIGLDHVDDLREIALEPGGERSVALPGGRVTVVGERLHWRFRPSSAARFARPLYNGKAFTAGDWRLSSRVVRRRPKPGPWRAVFDADRLGDTPLGVRSPRPGDRLSPLGLGGTKKLQDAFVDAKVPRYERASWPVVHRGSEILWVPGVSRSDAATVSDATRRFLVVEAARIRSTSGREPRIGRCARNHSTLPQHNPCVTVDWHSKASRSRVLRPKGGRSLTEDR